jgi:phosphohistidine phosphatase
LLTLFLESLEFSLEREEAMKTLILVRHATAENVHPELDDMDRPLEPCGEKESIQMAEELNGLELSVEAIISSPARRAWATARVFADCFARRVDLDERLYNGTDSDLLDVIQEMDEEYSTILLVGHNPSLSDLLCDLLDGAVEDLSTAAVAVLEFDVAEWPDVHTGGGTLEQLLVPTAFVRPHAA